MPKDRDQLTPDDPEDAAHLASHRGQGTAGTGQDIVGNDPDRAAAAAIAADEQLPRTDEGTAS